MTTLFDLWRRVARTAADRTPDADLLGRFLRLRDEAAFAALVDRHGPLVYGACRRLLPDPFDAEDAFQATFLVLVRRGGQLAGRPLSPWLHQVAVWTARNLRRRNAGRLAVVRPLDGNEAVAPTADTDARLDVDAALSILPRKYRVPLVLCHLQGWTRQEAAALLGCPESTLASLLSRGLLRLRRRLAGRDPAIVLAVAGSIAVPPTLSAAAVRAAVRFRTSSLSAAASPAVADLTQGVLRMFWVKKLALAGVVLAAVGMIGLGVWAGSGTGHRASAQAPAADDPKAQQEKLAKEIDDLRTRLKALEALKERQDQEEKLREARKRLAEKIAESNSSTLDLTVSSGSPALELKEFDKAGKVLLRVWPSDPDSLTRYLTRCHADPNGPRRLVVHAEASYPAAKLQEVLVACQAAGYKPEVGSGSSKDRLDWYRKLGEPVPKKDPGDPNGPAKPAVQLPPYVIEPPDVLRIEVAVKVGDETLPLPQQPISGSYQVRPDGTVGLGTWGSVSVTGLTMPAAANAIRKHLLATPALQDRGVKPEDVLVGLDVIAYNSKRYYVVVSNGDKESVHPFPCTGNETVLDAVANVKELDGKLGDAQVTVSLPAEWGNPRRLLAVDWKAITQGGDTRTNYQLKPGDRVYVKLKK
jgi:RNA polymerase sigma factor (sigma-70 family)